MMVHTLFLNTRSLLLFGLTVLLVGAYNDVSSEMTMISSGRNADGCLELFYVGSDGLLYHRSQIAPSGEWSCESRFAGRTKGVTVGQNVDGCLDVFYIGTDDCFYRKWRTEPDGGWSNEFKFADITKDAAVGQNADGRLEVFYIDGQDSLCHQRQTEPNGEWSNKTNFAGPASNVAVGQNLDGRLEVFYVGMNDSLYHKWQLASSGDWAAEAKFGGTAKRVSVGRNADGRLEIFVVAMDDRLYHKWQIAPNGSWSKDAPFADSAKVVAVGHNLDGRLEVIFTDMNDILHHNWQTVPSGGWADEKQFGWAARDMAVDQNDDGRLEVFYIGTDGVLYHNWQLQPGLHWAGEYPFPSDEKPLLTVDDFSSEPNYVSDCPNWHVNDHCFIQAKDGTWHMFGIVAPDPDQPNPPLVNYFGHATAQRLSQKSWEEQPPPFTESLLGGKVVWAPYIIHHQDRYYMFYCNGGDATQYAISLRTSSDLVHWSEPVVLFQDGFQARDPMVLRLYAENEWVMYYCATETAAGGQHVVAYRTSEDLLLWSKRAIAYSDYHAGTAYGPTESSFVVQRGEYFYLFIGPRPYDPPTESLPNWEHPGYVGTDVFCSKRWDRWTNADFVGHIRAHAAEIARDANGDWFVSSAGVKQGGLYLTRLYWQDGLDFVQDDGCGIFKPPEKFGLHQNYPNPFNSKTRIQFDLPKTVKVRIAVLDVMGHMVRILLDEDLHAGLHEVSWDGSDRNGIPMPSSIYICQIDVGNDTDDRKMVLLR
jgi:hypothetical protein